MATTDRRRPYLRIAEDIRRDIASGRYAVGERLPVARELADQYGVAMMTIGNALAVLRDEGLIETRQGAGSFVSRTPDDDTTADTTPGRAQRRVPHHLRAAARDSRACGEPDDQVGRVGRSDASRSRREVILLA
ncbi:GntR family transcriptional regulator [Nonomuraea salmonea]|uniref:GntR family transcriptional regulator n=1 Tax=Nonomuraea salmonea TaxID=46181 RepID=UPI002FEBB7F1